jgi:hypothetical protein
LEAPLIKEKNMKRFSELFGESIKVSPSVSNWSKRDEKDKPGTYEHFHHHVSGWLNAKKNKDRKLSSLHKEHIQDTYGDHAMEFISKQVKDHSDIDKHLHDYVS